MASKRFELVEGKGGGCKATIRADAGMTQYALILEEDRGSGRDIEFRIEQQRVGK